MPALDALDVLLQVGDGAALDIGENDVVGGFLTQQALQGAAQESTKSVNAQAYTVGSNIVFQRDKYDPASDSGKDMIAHELTHVAKAQR